MPLTAPTNTSDDGIWEGWDHDAKLATDVKPAELWDLPERTTSATGWANFVYGAGFPLPVRHPWVCDCGVRVGAGRRRLHHF